MGDIYGDIFGDNTAIADTSAEILTNSAAAESVDGWRRLGGWADFLSTTGQNLIGAKAARLIGGAPVARSPGGVDFVEGKPVTDSVADNSIFAGMTTNTALMIAAGLALVLFVMKSN